MRRVILIALTGALLMQCAAAYKPINPPTVQYLAKEENDDVSFEYRYDVLAYRDNRKYSKKEKKRAFNVVAIKVKNKTDRTLNFTEDLDLYTDRSGVFPMEAEMSRKALRQNVPIYLLYGLLVLNVTNCDGKDCHTQIYPIGLAIAAINMIIAGSANQKMKDEFNQYSVHNKAIQPGETMHAIIAIPDYGYAPLHLRLRQK